ncbi:putative retropepsins domain protein [Gregarina niphandrodes]|uniref:Retropepsins domain protein n=1 Tax=Gregarina niphandrodes TaxID=110365 RepID=A0A023AWI4_GRENI|nr:putative retropepsins domain protein [Gregarina niphandrodes]EZG43106.1 putative retropepsins domain protein [Gregarina niphandrodes]|eukprot:XP_011133637.1 putative retropepsins domain protein [Gregarina niphandrodes]
MPSESRIIVRRSSRSKPSKGNSSQDEELKILLKASSKLQAKIATLLNSRSRKDKSSEEEPSSSESSSDSSSSDSSDNESSSDSITSSRTSLSTSSNRSRVVRGQQLELLREARQPRTYIDYHSTRRLIKELNIKESFNPRHEKAYDDQLDLLERLTRAKGFEVNLLPQVITSVADDNVLYRINKHKLHKIQEWQTFRDCLAKKLYPYSNEIDVVAQSLSETEDREDAEDLVMWFEKTVQRYHMLRRRWKHPNAFHSHQLKQALLNKLCAPLQAEAMRSDWRQWDLDRFIQFVLKCNDDLARRQRRRSPKVGLVAAVPTRDMPMQDGTQPLHSSVRNAINKFNQSEATQFYEAGEIPETPRDYARNKNPTTYTCRWCKSPQHGSRDCPTKPTCKVCGKKGHDESSCYRVTRQGKLATQQITFTNTPHGMVVNMKEDSSNLAVLEGLSKYFNEACVRVKEAKSKAIARKAEATTEKPTLTGAVNVTTDEESGGLYGKFMIGNTDIVCLVDPGADKNIMNWKTLESLPVEYKCLWKPIDEGKMSLNFVQGSCPVTGSIELPVTSPLGNVEMEFYIVKEARLNILGNPWMRTLKAAVCFKDDEVRNEAGKLPLFTKEVIPYSDVFNVELWSATNR